MDLFIKLCLVILGTFLSSFLVLNECVSTLFSSSTLIRNISLSSYTNLYVNNHNYIKLLTLYNMHSF